MKAVLTLVKILLAAVVLMAVAGFFLPRNVHVERSIDLAVPREKIFTVLNDLTQFNRWSPWARIDPATHYEFSGPPAGVGARMLWRSDNPRVGAGSQEITASIPDHRVEVALDFGSQGIATGYYDLQAAGDGTRVTWGFDTDLGVNPIARYLGLMFDTWIGADYEQGLANLKELLEGGAADGRMRP